ncbi:HK97 family phage portal protein [Azospirillum agricola]|uniref:phage portal protein n=1 Tax=Azospirillum agricola TaxID=1720247 RepID=UPI001AE686E1|nr:phage portal protein [Azospirillum agricola]MBP2229655.1 HK97 family phage portal protein [Azospirillum agricola]
MGIWNWIASRLQPPPQAAVELSGAIWDDVTGGATAAGVYVTSRKALETPTSLRCGLLISDGVSTVPCKLMRKDPVTGKRTEAVDHPLYDLMQYKPCGWMNTQQFRETLMLHAAFQGGGFAYINKVGRGRVREMFTFEAGEVLVEKRSDSHDRSPLYRVNGEEVPNDRILHIRGPSWNGRAGLNMVDLAREVIGLADAAQDAHAKRFGNGVQTTGVYSIEGALDDKEHKRLTNWIKAHYAGGKNSGKPLILGSNGKFVPFGMSGADAEHLATRQYQDMLICRQWGVLPAVVGIADKTATYASSEQMFLAHNVHTIRPWHRRFGTTLTCDLLTPEERSQGLYFKFFDTELLRGAAKDRAEFYAKMFQVAGITPNQILGLEDMDGFEGGDQHYIPANFARVREDGSLEAASKPGEGGDDDDGEPPPGWPPRQNAGRVLSGENERLIRGASDNLNTVLDKLDGQQED